MAAPLGAAIVVTRETGQEIDNLGVKLYRAESSSGPMVRLTDALIPTSDSLAQVVLLADPLEGDVLPII